MRGTTPTHIFKKIPIDIKNIKRAMVIYAQNNVEVFNKDTTKDADAFAITDGEIRVTLTQEDTLKLSHLRPVQIQLRILSNDGNAYKTKVRVVSVDECLNNEVLE